MWISAGFRKRLYTVLALVLIVVVGIMMLPGVTLADPGEWQPYDGPEDDTPPEQHYTKVIDPVGDTFGIGPVQHDITLFSAYYTATELIITVEFDGAISPPLPMQADSVVGYIDIDADQDWLTGDISNIDDFSPYSPTNLGVDYAVDLWAYNPVNDTVALFDEDEIEVGTAVIEFEANSFVVTIPLSIMNNDDGNVNTAVVIGPFEEPTDIAPNGGNIPSSPLDQAEVFVGGTVIPESVLEILLPVIGLGLLPVMVITGGYWYRRRRHAH